MIANESGFHNTRKIMLIMRNLKRNCIRFDCILRFIFWLYFFNPENKKKQNKSDIDNEH